MALHTQLPIYRAAEDLLDVVTDVVTNMQRDFKRSIGEKINFECIEIIVLVYRANVAGNKSPHLTELIERLQVINLLLRLGFNKRRVHKNSYARAIELTTSIGKQANAWRKSANNRPLQGGQGFHG
ncbi:four helix bundle protein [Burkholderia vietnamiensis]